MNRNILIGAAIAAGTTALIYFIRKNRKAANGVMAHLPKRTRHLTNAFAKAKHNTN